MCLLLWGHTIPHPASRIPHPAFRILHPASRTPTTAPQPSVYIQNHHAYPHRTLTTTYSVIQLLLSVP
ncbi:hypothetical protein, partial [Vibrio rhodolitus]|uniref:hypothetical protein n=1 Tax=Vibrio rhodolitus TaxID=2231649 RepID=UPI001ABEFE06